MSGALQCQMQAWAGAIEARRTCGATPRPSDRGRALPPTRTLEAGLESYTLDPLWYCMAPHGTAAGAHLGGEVAHHVGQVAAPERGDALLRRHAGEAVDDAGVAGDLRGSIKGGGGESGPAAKDGKGGADPIQVARLSARTQIRRAPPAPPSPPAPPLASCQILGLRSWVYVRSATSSRPAPTSCRPRRHLNLHTNPPRRT